MATKEYQKEWRKNHKKEYKRYRKKYETNHPEYLRLRNKTKMIKRRQSPKWKEYYKKYHSKYMKTYPTTESGRIKKRVRLQTQRIYGKVPKGYERHHLNYDCPHNFILVPIKEHRKIHNHIQAE